MLSELDIENIALIDKLRLNLREGLNILSGETGAGKSIIIDSLNFVLGERADKSLIRYGTDCAVVQAVFEDYANDALLSYMADVGIDDEGVLILRRKMTLDGKNECRINGRVTTLSVLKGLTELLVDIHGQHEHQSLLKSANHIGLLDSLGGEKLASILKEVRLAHKKYSDLKAEAQRYGNGAERERRLDILNFQIKEIESLALKEGEIDELRDQLVRIRHMQKIIDALEGAKAQLDGSDGMGVAASVKTAASLVDGISKYDQELDPIVERLNSAKFELQDISDTLGEMLFKLDFDSRSADEKEERLDNIHRICRKYASSQEDSGGLFAFYDNAKSEADALLGADERVQALTAEIEEAGAALVKKAEKLTALRKKTAASFEKDMVKELSDLGMGGSSFKVDIKSAEAADEISSDGADSVEFLISPNLGEPLKPLAKIISGGEMSRFMLALKNIVAGIDGIGTMVFDEIDTGISGKISAVVSEKLCNISRARQVIAVTHMPGLAAMADSHYLISKATEGGKTLTRVTLLDDDTDEVARLIGGNDYSQFAVPHAKEMKAWAEQYKRSLK